MRRERLVSSALTLIVMLFSLVPPAAAQRTTATFAGVVTDTSGGVLPGTDVELSNEGTGIVERQVTSETGEFIFNYVPGGTYTLTISISGFRTYKASGIALGAAQNLRRTFQLEVGEMEESITVSGESPLINTASGEQRISLDPLEVKTLPAANRNLTNLLNIGTGLTRQEGTVEGGGSGSGGAGGIRLRLNGLGGAAMSITANGTDASANAGARQISQYNGISKIDIVSIESVGEVQIVKGISPAEFGHALAGNLNIVTKGGTNNYHGSLFHRYEGAALVSKPFFLKEKPDSKWNQGGGSLGGPLMKDRGFFFVAAESYRLQRALELNVNVPTQRFRDLLQTALPYPETKLLLDQYLLPTEPVTSTALLGVFIGAGNKENNDDHVDTRADFRIKGGNLSGTFTYGHPFLTQESQLPGQPRVWVSLTRRASASYAVARGNWSSETRFGYNYNWLSRTDPFYNVLDPVNPGPEDINAKNRRQIPSISYPGLLTLGSEQHTRGQQPSYSFEQQSTLIAGKHSFKVGGIYATPRGGRFNVTGPSFSFSSEADILANRPSSISFRLRPVKGLWSTTNWGLFAQDDWRVTSKLVINMGVRYDWFSRYVFEGTDPENPAGIINLDGLPDPSFTFGAPRSADRIFEDDAKLNLGPRVGFAYNPDGGGHTVLSGGWGMMFQPLDTQNFETSIGMISGIPATTNFSAVEAANLGLRYPIYNEDMLDPVPGDSTPPARSLPSGYWSIRTSRRRTPRSSRRECSTRSAGDGGRRRVCRHPWLPFQNGQDLQRAGSADRDPAQYPPQPGHLRGRLPGDDLRLPADVDANEVLVQAADQSQLHLVVDARQLRRRQHAELGQRCEPDGPGFLRPRILMGSRDRRRHALLHRQRDLRDAGSAMVVAGRPASARRLADRRDLPGAHRRAADRHPGLVQGRQPSGRHRRRECHQPGVLRHQQQRDAVPEPGRLPGGGAQRGVAADGSRRQRRRRPVPPPGVEEPRRLAEQRVRHRRPAAHRATGRHPERAELDQLRGGPDQHHRLGLRQGHRHRPLLAWRSCRPVSASRSASSANLSCGQGSAGGAPAHPLRQVATPWPAASLLYS